MRELVYLSDRKLRQFLPDPVPRWRRLGHIRAEVKAPLGSVSIEPTLPNDVAAQRAHLEKVIANVEQNAQWFESDALHPGEWIFLEEQLNYRTFRAPGEIEVVLFLNLNRNNPGQTRLLLHGSPEHLSGPAPRGYSLETNYGSASDRPIFTDLVGVLPDLIKDLDSGIDLQALHSDGPYHEARKRSVWGPYTLEDQIKEIVKAFDKSNHSVTAAWLSGYARVTAVFDPELYRNPFDAGHNYVKAVVVASPLYLEYCSPPPGQLTET
jgi:hypothetical protein